MKFFYRYSSGYCGSDVYGTLEADTEDEVYKELEEEVLEYMESMCEEEDMDCEPESDLFVTEYVPEDHDGYL